MSSNLNRQHLLAMVALGLLLAAGAIVYHQSGGSSSSSAGDTHAAYYIDLSSGQLFVGDADRNTPFTTESGATAVKAVVFSCGSCDAPEERRIAWVQKQTDEAIKLLARGIDTLRPDQQELIDRGTLVAAWQSGKPGRWLQKLSETGSKITTAWRGQCGGQPYICSP